MNARHEAPVDSGDHMALASSRLLDANGTDTAMLAAALNLAARTDTDYADIYLQARNSESWALEDGCVKRSSFSFDEGFGLRTVTDDRAAFAFSESISKETLSDAGRAVGKMGGHGGGRAKVGECAAPCQSARDAGHYTINDPLSSLGAADKVAILHRLDAIVRCVDPAVRRVFATLSAVHDTVLVINAEGRISADIRPQVSLGLRVVVERAGRIENAFSGLGGRHDYRRFDEGTLTRLAKRVVGTALGKLDAAAAPSGEMTVVMGSGWPGILLHEAVGHGLEGDYIYRGTSAFSGRVGEQVTAPGITIVDNGCLHEHRGSLSIDDEGNGVEETVLIENGVLRGFMHDATSARLLGTGTTGNGRRESFARLPQPRMTNTYMLNGEYNTEEVIESVKSGLYIVDLNDGQVDIVSGNFVFAASVAYLIENGRITRPVKGATLTGNGLQTLKKISMVANDLAQDPGIATCGKAGQSLPVCVGQPTLRVDGITVGGTS